MPAAAAQAARLQPPPRRRGGGWGLWALAFFFFPSRASPSSRRGVHTTRSGAPALVCVQLLMARGGVDAGGWPPPWRDGGTAAPPSSPPPLVGGGPGGQECGVRVCTRVSLFVVWSCVCVFVCAPCARAVAGAVYVCCPLNGLGSFIMSARARRPVWGGGVWALASHRLAYGAGCSLPGVGRRLPTAWPRALGRRRRLRLPPAQPFPTSALRRPPPLAGAVTTPCHHRRWARPGRHGRYAGRGTAHDAAPEAGCQSEER